MSLDRRLETVLAEGEGQREPVSAVAMLPRFTVGLCCSYVVTTSVAATDKGPTRCWPSVAAGGALNGALGSPEPSR